jgi:hypothetical protein
LKLPLNALACKTYGLDDLELRVLPFILPCFQEVETLKSVERMLGRAIYITCNSKLDNILEACRSVDDMVKSL